MAAKPNMTRSTRTRLLPSAPAVCPRRPPSLPPRCAPPGARSGPVGPPPPRLPLAAIHDVRGVPRVQDVVSSCRLVQCARASAGTRYGTSGATLGKAHLTWAFAAAAVLFLRDHPAAQKYLARVEKKHDTGHA